MQIDPLSAYDYSILKTLGAPNKRKTVYVLALKTGLDEHTVQERLEKLIELGFVKQWRKQSGNVNFSRI